jgi:hypothetical protein
MQALLQAGEIQPAVAPERQFAVEHYLDVQLPQRGDDLREVQSERPLLTGVQRDALSTAMGEKAEAVHRRGHRGLPLTPAQTAEVMGLRADHRPGRNRPRIDPA